jgi:signal transduction histidine kinase
VTGMSRARAGLIMEAVGAGLLVIACAVELGYQRPQLEMRLSLSAAAVLLVAAAVSTAVRRAQLVALGGLSLILAVSQVVRVTQKPLFNGLDIVPLLLIGCAVMLGRGATLRRRSLERERAQARSAGEEQERRRWARELHDETLQGLGAVQIVLSAATGTGQAAAIEEAINQARSLIADQITSLRHLIVELRPSALDQLGLAPALEALCQRAKVIFEPDVELVVGAGWSTVGDELSPEAQAHVYRIVQEAISNAVKHAQATRILVEIDSDDHVVNIRIRDNGRGMSQLSSIPADRPESRAMVSTGTGLPAMRERASLLDGRLVVRSTPFGGTCVDLRLRRHGDACKGCRRGMRASDEIRIRDVSPSSAPTSPPFGIDGAAGQAGVGGLTGEVEG